MSEDEYEPATQETHTQGVVSSALRRLEKDMIDPDADDFQGDPPTVKHGSRVSSEIYSNSRSESDEENEDDNAKDAPPPLICHATARRKNRTRRKLKPNCR